MQLMEDLPVEVQEEIIRQREAMVAEGWDLNAHATAEQWISYFRRLPEEARLWMVGNLLELAQQGSLCRQAQHEGQQEVFWQQLRGVTELHNARVDEVAALRRRVAELEGRPLPEDDRPPSERVAELAPDDLVEVKLGEGDSLGKLFVANPHRGETGDQG